MKEIIIDFLPFILIGGIAIGGMITAYIKGWDDEGVISVEGNRKD